MKWIADYTCATNLPVDVPAYRELGLRGDGDVDERGLRREVLAHLDEDLEGVAPVQLLLLAVVLQQPLHELGRHRGVVLEWSVSDVDIFKSRFSSFQVQNHNLFGRLQDPTKGIGWVDLI